MSEQLNTNTCLNCEQHFSGGFCSACGQKASTQRFDLKHILQHLPHELFHLDQKGILKNIMSIIQPRETVRGYLNGKRVGYFSPFLFFLFSLGAVLFIETALDKYLTLTFEIETGTDANGNEVFENAGPTLTKWLKYLFFTSVFVFALPNWLLFKKDTKFYYAEQVIISMFVMGYANLLYLLIIAVPFVQSYPANFFYPGFVICLYIIVLHERNFLLTGLKVILSVAVQVALLLLTLILAAAFDIKVLH